jgi:hypothetical protein
MILPERSLSRSGSATLAAGSPSHNAARSQQALNPSFSPTWVFLALSLGHFLDTDFPHSFLDRDGTIDLLITTCALVSHSTGLGTNCALNIAYNTQLPLCASTSSLPFSSGPRIKAPCRSPDALCVADSNFTFSFSGPVGPAFLIPGFMITTMRGVRTTSACQSRI